MTCEIRIRGTTDADSIAAVLAVLHRVEPAPAPAVTGVAAWRIRRRAALARTVRAPRR